MSEIPHRITRTEFRNLIDPLLESLGTQAGDIESCYFDWNGFQIVVFDRDEDGRRLATEGGDAAKQTVRVHIAKAVS